MIPRINQQKSDDSLRDQVISGFKWLTVGKFSGQLINWGITFFVIRLLEPSDYGLMAMGSIFIAFFSLMNEMGLGASIIQNEEMETSTLQQIFGIVIIINMTLFCLLYFVSPLIGLFFNEQQLIPIVKLLSVQFIIMAFLVIPQSLMDRDFDFKNRSIVDLIANLLGGIITLWFAWTGHGVWSLIWGSILILFFRTLGYNIFHPFLFVPVFSFTGMRKVMTFGGYITIEKLLWYFYSQADTLIIGKFLGKELLGFYSIGKEVASLPLQKIMPIINQIVFPAFARIQKDIGKFGSHTLKSISIISFFAFPVFLGIASISSELVAVVLGNKWTLAVPPLIFISTVLPLRMIIGILVSILKSIGRADISFQNNIVSSVLMIFGFLIGCNWGIIGISLVWPVVYPVCFILILIRSSIFVGIRTVNVLTVMYNPFFSSLIMFAAVKGIRNFIDTDPGSLFQLVVLIFTGALVYGGLQIAFNRKEINSIKNYISKE